MDSLLIEIGCEELPAGYIRPALDAFKANMKMALKKARISHGRAKTLGTPRRLALVIEEVAHGQAPHTSVLTGPPENLGIDETGALSLAAKKFAHRAGIDPDCIQVQDTPKGRYLTAEVQETCESSWAILEQLLEDQILSIPFPKRMRWASLSISFARPIISLVGLLGDQVLDFTVGDIRSGNHIFGHPFMHPGKHTLPCAKDYVDTLESAGVVPDMEKRRQMILDAIQCLAEENHAQLLTNGELVDTVTNLVEYPYPVIGRFDEQFLDVPDEILISVICGQQKYFPLGDENGALKPLFIAINNTRARDMDLVAQGHGKVLRARLSDAKFFYETDLQSGLDDLALKLENLTFQEKLGSVGDKTRRIGGLVIFLVHRAPYENVEALKIKLSRAAAICKADLASQVVIAFTRLQGVMGRVYAQKAGENPHVADAVEQHYRPIQSKGPLPENPVAAILAIADKLDTICGCFYLGLVPTGGNDPYALRRQGIGLLRIMLNENLELSLDSLIQKGVSLFSRDPAGIRAISSQVKVFFQNRMKTILIDQGYAREAINSALAASFDNIPDVQLRVEALDSLRRELNFDPLCVTFKRVENILKQAVGFTGSIVNPMVDQGLFQDPCEHRLFHSLSTVQSRSGELIQQGDYHGALREIADLSPDVDLFFENVRVFADDRKIRNNRLGMVASVCGLFHDIADFSMM